MIDKLQKIAFICSTEGGMDIEKVAEEDPKKIITLKFEISEKLDDKKLNELVEIFKLSDSQKKEAMNLLESIYRFNRKRCKFNRNKSSNNYKK